MGEGGANTTTAVTQNHTHAYTLLFSFCLNVTNTQIYSHREKQIVHVGDRERAAETNPGRQIQTVTFWNEMFMLSESETAHCVIILHTLPLTDCCNGILLLIQGREGEPETD